MTRLSYLLTASMLATLPWTARAQIGPEFQVNNDTIGHQFQPAVGADGSGDFVALWSSLSVGIFGRRYDSDGNPLSPEFQVTTPASSRGAVAADAAGNFVAVWNRPNEVFGRRYDSGGNPVGPEFQVNTQPTYYTQSAPAVAAAATGNFMVTWESLQDASGFGIFAQRYDSGGNPVGGEFQVNTYTTSAQSFPVLAADAAGNILVVWSSLFQDASDGWGVFGQRIDGAGNLVGSEFQVNTYTTGHQFDHDVAADGAGSFVVAWDSVGQDGDQQGVFARRYDGGGNPLGGEFQVNTYTTGEQSGPAVAADGAGNFVVLWHSIGQDGGEYGVFGQRFDSSGAPLGGEFAVNGYTPGAQADPTAVAIGTGSFVVLWTSEHQDRDGFGIFGQRYDSTGRQGIRGSRLKLANTSSGRRTVDIRGREVWSNSVVAGDPLTYGATARVIAHGDNDQDQLFNLPPGASGPGVPGWKAASTGWTYTDQLGVNGPVRRANVKRLSQQTFFLQTVIRGTASTPPPGIGVVPPGNGTDGGLVFTILGPGGGTYCVDMGGANGGTVRNSATRFTVHGSTTETDCPSP